MPRRAGLIVAGDVIVRDCKTFARVCVLASVFEQGVVEQTLGVWLLMRENI
jgi:hypothetical protein